MVTPPYKEGFPVTASEASEDGSQLSVASLGNFVTRQGKPPASTGQLVHTYRLIREKAGWRLVPVDAPFSSFPVINVPSLSPDFDSSIWYAGAPRQSFEDIYLNGSDGELTKIGPGTPPGALETALDFAGSSKDFHRSLFVVTSPNGGEENRLWPGDTTFSERKSSLYEYVGTGNAEPELVGIKNSGPLSKIAKLQGKAYVNEAAELISNCGTVLGSGTPAGDAYNSVSESGNVVFFTSKACSGGPPVDELYARIEQEKTAQEETIAISEPPLSVPGRKCEAECAMAESVPGNRKPGTFAGASSDGSRVFFLTDQPLVNADTDGTSDLYAADIHEGTVTRLTQVSRGGEGDLTPGSGAGVLGVARVSEDGSHVYFVAQGVLTPANSEKKAPAAGEPNLYVAVRECPGGGSPCEDPVERTSFVAKLSSSNDGGDWASSDMRSVQATPDGRFFVFESTEDLTPDQDGREEAGQVFEYDAQTEKLVRVSRGQGAYNEDGNSNAYPATIPIQKYNVGTPDARYTNLAVSSDGARVFFTSADALTPQALSGIINVYEYEYSDGRVGLISDGHDVTTVNGASPAGLIGTDESGRDVFFTTGDQLLPQDRDTAPDIYDARIEGGFEPPAVTAPCVGDPCQGAGSPIPLLVTPGISSGMEEGPGAKPTSKPKTKVKKKKARKPKNGKRKHMRGAHKPVRGKGIKAKKQRA